MHRLRVALILIPATLLLSAATAKEPARTTDKADAKTTRTKSPEELVDDTVGKVLKILGSPEYKDRQKRKKLREKVRLTILSVVDMKTVSMLTLANYRKKFSEAQFKRFMADFSHLLFSTYVKHLEKYSDEKVVILGTRELSPTRVQVRTKTVTATREIPVDFSFVKQGKKWMLYDVHIEGVSIVRNYRSQFREILLKRSIEQFLKMVEKKARQNEESK